MSYFRSYSIRRIALVSLLLVALVPAAIHAQELPPTVSPDSGPPGTRFLFSARGFTGRERLSFWVNRPDGKVEAVNTELERSSDSGDAVWSWTSPSGGPLGTWQMVAHGNTSNVERVVTFTLAEPNAPAAQQPFNVVPRSGDAGTLFRFYATGYNAGEYVDVQVHGPGGANVQMGDTSLVVGEPASADGRIDGSWTSPANATIGDWQIVARGSASGVTRTITITIGSSTQSRAELQVSPSEGAPGQRFVFSATGFTANEEISIWLNRPDGSVAAAEIEGIAKAAPD
ncbi:MAG TPA: hypothetical protein VFX76_05715, partial [Roseiflexaceae bacterium]|nr:hypothetical protein [Roseiflexaceae bacterium]